MNGHLHVIDDILEEEDAGDLYAVTERNFNSPDSIDFPLRKDAP